ncbi:uncharacterized protein BDR25DRAFT_281428 [Lindgomyces ingoldianus]|uniref:Uncharacterized protein n=1 Tax=Lindgomyces ingoldianus TaxID=673940 RepID=A0ACB6R397_9PLEO|nr:uncharacterized protein BDR25DRAFT_281428 [Lindgomyces ingoldianus]KAF2473537.1 hypothetical protein BDR25DRAFT_281428 [Lindgomyces ingoldianus]
MVTKGVNRFALLADDGSPPSEADENRNVKPHISNGNTGPHEPATHSSSQWKENVKPVGTRHSNALKTLVIRGLEYRAPAHSKQKSPPFVSPVSQVDDSNSGRNGFPDHWCGVCQAAFGSKAALYTHAKHTPRHENYCNLCTRVFKDRNGLKNHVDNSVGHEIFCNSCLSAFKDTNGLRNHFENNYVVGHEFACLVCLMAFKSRKEMEHHLQTAMNHVWCRTCHRRFRNQDERDEHWIKTTRHKHCLQTGCDFDGPNQEALQKHMLEGHYHCDNCGVVFPSQTKLNAHIQSCFLCKACDFHTSHEGNYLNVSIFLPHHMTKHVPPTLSCWACQIPLKTQSSLINHIESGGCPLFPNPDRFTKLLGRWWYSTLYMDIGIHAQLRQGSVDMDTLNEMVHAGAIEPFVCRADGCGRVFRHMSSLVLHVESQACEWDVQRLGLDKLKDIFQQEFSIPGRVDQVTH